MSRNSLVSLSAALLLSCSLPALAHAQTPQEMATKALSDKHIAVDNDSFLSEVKAGHLENVKLFIQLGAHAGTQGKDGVSALMASMHTTNQDVVNLLFSTLQADPHEVMNLKDKSENTILLQAVYQGNAAFVDLLLAHGAAINVTNTITHATPLIVAVQRKNEAITQKLVDADAKSTPANTTLELADVKGNKPLTYAITEQNPALVKLLLAAHADAVQPDTIGVTPLMLAAQGGDEGIAEMLIAAGAKVNLATKSGANAVSLAIHHGHGKLARTLIEKDPAGASAMNYATALTEELNAEKIDPDFFAYLLSHTSKTEVLPPELLFAALDRKQHDVAKLLLDRKPDVKAVNQDNETLFYHALDSGFEDIALQLMDMGADTTQTGVTGVSPLARAVRHNMPKIAAALIERGASVDQKTPEGYTLAEMCVYTGYPETLEVLLNHNVKLEKEFALLWSIRDGKGLAVPVLLDHGASSAIMNQEGIPAISMAAELGEVEAIKGFIAHKAVLDYPSKTQRITALASAARAGHLAVVKLLVEAGAPIEAVDGFGMTPLAHAASTNKDDVVEYLLSKNANAKAVDNQKRSVMDIAGQAPSSPERDKIIQMLGKAAAH